MWRANISKRGNRPTNQSMIMSDSHCVIMQPEYIFRNLNKHNPERIFASDIMTHISGSCELRHIPCESMCSFGLVPDSPFKLRMKEAVDRMMCKAKILSTNLFGQFVGFDQPTIPKFELAVRRMGFQLKVDGFQERAFLEFCTTVCLMAILGRRNGLVTAPNSTVMLIEEVVQSFKVLRGWPENAWENIESEAEHFQY